MGKCKDGVVTCMEWMSDEKMIDECIGWMSRESKESRGLSPSSQFAFVPFHKSHFINTSIKNFPITHLSFTPIIHLHNTHYCTTPITHLLIINIH